MIEILNIIGSMFIIVGASIMWFMSMWITMVLVIGAFVGINITLPWSGTRHMTFTETMALLMLFLIMDGALLKLVVNIIGA